MKNIISKAKLIVLSSFLSLFTVGVLDASAYVMQSSQKLCPTKVLETKTLLAKYKGWEYSNSYNGGIVNLELADGATIEVYTPQELADTLFGQNIGKTINVTYETIQEFSHKDNFCGDLKVLRYGRVLDSNGYNLSSFINTVEPRVFYINTVEGTYDGYWEGTDFGNIDMLIDGKKYSFICGHQEAEELFGKNSKGKKFSFSYTVERLDFDGYPINNFCLSATPTQ